MQKVASGAMTCHRGRSLFPIGIVYARKIVFRLENIIGCFRSLNADVESAVRVQKSTRYYENSGLTVVE